MKVCSKCKIEKSLLEFSKGNDKNGLQYQCKECKRKNDSKYYKENSETIKENVSNYRIDHLEYYKDYDKKYYNEHKEKSKEYNKNWRELHKEEKRINDAKYKEDNREKLRLQQLEYYNNHKEEYNAYDAKRRLEHPERNLNYKNKRRKIDPLFKLRGNIRSLVGKCIREGGFKKTSKTFQILGCIFEEFIIYIENQFSEGMNWNNYGLWHLDHIYPVSLAENEEHLIQLNHYTNFQPLWAEDNLRKGNKIL
jgi:hypothetical protein